ncbi:MAG TPA: hypothetical protein VJQ83_02415 [Tepidiformaceae bacterium]|nr:hypothetical protein [Tepidiformaceae bacterium]
MSINLRRHEPRGAALAVPVPGPQASGERSLLMRALQDLAGSARGVIYDVPAGQKPHRTRPGAPSVAGSPAWDQYIRTRRQVDDGGLTLVISLRTLDDDERRLAVDWGARYANSFVLIEPRDVLCDLADVDNSAAIRVADAVARTPDPGPVAESGWSRGTPLGRLLRELYGRWVYWPSPAADAVPEEELLDLGGHGDTLALQLLRAIPRRFPQDAFDRSMTFLLFWERELFGGPVPRVRSVFRTRLGMPILHDPYCADRALRRLVNAGRLPLVGPTEVPRLSYGFGSPVPSELTDEEFEQLVMA